MQAAGTWYQSLVHVVPNAVLTVAVIHTDRPGSPLLDTRDEMMIIVELSSHFTFLQSGQRGRGDETLKQRRRQGRRVGGGK